MELCQKKFIGPGKFDSLPSTKNVPTNIDV